MRSELTVPQVFEPGARLRAGRDGASFILEEKRDGLWMIGGMAYDDEAIAAVFSVVAPAPRAGQRWECDRGVFNYMATFGYDVLDVARWLLDHGLDYAGPADAAPATLRASEAAAVEPTPATAPPAPWTLTAARRLIAETIASAKPRRPDAFTAALCALAEHGVPPAKLVTETAAAISALERALPEHGAVARWQAERAMWEARDRLKDKLNGTQTIIALAAATLYLQRRGAW